MWLNIVKLVTKVNNFIPVISADLDSELTSYCVPFLSYLFSGEESLHGYLKYCTLTSFLVDRKSVV